MKSIFDNVKIGKGASLEAYEGKTNLKKEIIKMKNVFEIEVTTKTPLFQLDEKGQRARCAATFPR